MALAEKVEPLGFNGFDPKAFNPDGTEEDAHRTVNAMVAFNRPNAKLIPASGATSRSESVEPRSTS